MCEGGFRLSYHKYTDQYMMPEPLPVDLLMVLCSCGDRKQPVVQFPDTEKEGNKQKGTKNFLILTPRRSFGSLELEYTRRFPR